MCTTSAGVAEARLRARIYLAVGLPDAAIAVLRNATVQPPADADTIRLLLHAIERRGATIEPGDLGAMAADLESAERFELMLRAALLRHDDEAVQRLYAAASDLDADAGDPVLKSVITALIRGRDFDRIERLLALTGRSRPQHLELLLTVIDAAIAAADWDRAGELLAQGEALSPDQPEAGLQSRQLMVDCLRLDLEAAEARVRTWAEIPEMTSAAVAALLASLGRWDEILDLLRDRVERGYNITSRLFLESVTKAVRETGRYLDALALVDVALETWPVEPLTEFRDRLLAELGLAQLTGRAEPADVPTAEIQAPLYAERSFRLARAMGAEPAAGGARMIYLCTDANYLPGTVVALFSLLRNNPTVGRRASVQVIVSDDALPVAESIIAEIATAFAISVTVVPASAIVADVDTLRTTWGAFTPGHGLSGAAYYRIFAAARMAASGIGGRALYLDSDVLVGGGIERLLELDLGGMPLGSRRELPLPEILQAAKRLDVPAEMYFNSGVLLFDLDHPELPDALADAIDFAAHKPELLTFVDQCALNVAFLGRTADLPAECNYYLRQDDEWTLAWEPTVLHYLARPKPWDPAYRTAHCRRWVHEFELLGQVVSSAKLRAVMAGLFPALTEVTPGTPTAPLMESGSP